MRERGRERGKERERDAGAYRYVDQEGVYSINRISVLTRLHVNCAHAHACPATRRSREGTRLS